MTLVLQFNEQTRLEVSAECKLEELQYQSIVNVNLYFGDEAVDFGSKVLGGLVRDLIDFCHHVADKSPSLHTFFEKIDVGYYYNLFVFNTMHHVINRELFFLLEDISINYHLIDSSNYALFYYEKQEEIRLQLVPLYPHAEDSDLGQFMNWSESSKSNDTQVFDFINFEEVKNTVYNLAEIIKRS